MINIVAKRYWFFLISAVVIVPGIISLGLFGLKPGLDFRAGTELTLAAIATRVGYANPFALSAAFKRVHGVAPSRYRAQHAA